MNERIMSVKGRKGKGKGKGMEERRRCARVGLGGGERDAFVRKGRGRRASFVVEFLFFLSPLL